MTRTGLPNSVTDPLFVILVVIPFVAIVKLITACLAAGPLGWLVLLAVLAGLRFVLKD